MKEKYLSAGGKRST